MAVPAVAAFTAAVVAANLLTTRYGLVPRIAADRSPLRTSPTSLAIS
jgi:hypothetical protein